MTAAAWAVHLCTNPRADKSQNSMLHWMFYLVSLWASQGYFNYFTYTYLMHNNQSVNQDVFVTGLTLRNPSNSMRVLCAFSAIGIFIVANYFTAAYTSTLSMPVFKTPITSVEDLANTNVVATLLIKGSSTDGYIMVLIYIGYMIYVSQNDSRLFTETTFFFYRVLIYRVRMNQQWRK